VPAHIGDTSIAHIPSVYQLQCCTAGPEVFAGEEIGAVSSEETERRGRVVDILASNVGLETGYPG